jgi:hypothetical protein
MLAHHLWERVEQGAAAALADRERAHAGVPAEPSPEFDAQWRRMQANDRKTLRAIIVGGGSAYRQAVPARLELDEAAARRAAARPTGPAELEREGRRHRVVDPRFRGWIARADAGEPDAGGDEGP